MKQEKTISWLTTFDNPYDPFDDFNQWFVYDVTKGYNSCGYLARIAKISESLTDDENYEIIEDAIDEIINLDPFGIYKKVKKTVPVKIMIDGEGD